MSAGTPPHLKVNYGQVSLAKEAGIMTQGYRELHDLLPEHNSLYLQTATAHFDPIEYIILPYVNIHSFSQNTFYHGI